MTDEEIKNLIKQTAKETVKESMAEYKRSGLLEDSEGANYSDACELLQAYYDGEKDDMEISYAVQNMRFDQYFRILEMYFERHEKIETIAREMDVDVSTITRNKKRLCLAIYKSLCE